MTQMSSDRFHLPDHLRIDQYAGLSSRPDRALLGAAAPRRTFPAAGGRTNAGSRPPLDADCPAPRSAHRCRALDRLPLFDTPRLAERVERENGAGPSG